jgi:protein phosphatase
MGTEGSGASRAGGEGIHNEDAFLVEEGMGLYLVCDGQSGKPAGEVAARVATEAVETFVERREAELAAPRLVERAMAFALTAVAEAERTLPELRGLATTVTMLLVRGNLGVFGHLGDSRAYLLRRGRAHLLTRDHVLTAEYENGGGSDTPFDVFAVDLEPGDTIVLCTDGAEEVVGDVAIVRAAADFRPRILASRIVSEAHRRRPNEDATAVVVRVRSELEPGWLELSLPSRGTTFGHTLQPR